MPVWLAIKQFVLSAVLFVLTVVFFCWANQSTTKTKNLEQQQQAAPVPMLPILPITVFSRHGNLLLKLPAHLWRHVLSFYGFKEYMLAGRICTYVYDLWKEAVAKKRLPLFVPVDCNTLKEAVGRVHGDDRLTTIVVGKGEHQIDGRY